MDANLTPSHLSAAPKWLGVLAVVLAILLLAFACWVWAWPYFLQITDQAGPFHLTFSAADLDNDGDPDLLVHNLRRPGEFEFFSGGRVWINQGGAQGGEAGRFAYDFAGLEGGEDSTIQGMDSAAADLDNDGDADILAYDGLRLLLAINQGGAQRGQAGIFHEVAAISPPREWEAMYGSAYQFARVLTGDINQDGRIDALVLGCCGRRFKSSEKQPDQPNLSWVWINQTGADGRFGGELTGGLNDLAGMPVNDGAFADLDGDGDLDLYAVLHNDTGQDGPHAGSLVLLNQGNGRFAQTEQWLLPDYGTSVALGDVDGDGDVDALVGFESGAMVRINLGGMQNGTPGLFSKEEKYFIAGQNTRSVHLADLNGDRSLDAVLVGQAGAQIWLKRGEGYYPELVQTIPCKENQDMTVGDFNGDGWPDIFVATYDQTAQVWLNDGKGTFTANSR